MVAWFYMGFEAQLRCHLLHAAFPAFEMKLVASATTQHTLILDALCYLFCQLYHQLFGDKLCVSFCLGSSSLGAPSAPTSPSTTLWALHTQGMLSTHRLK